MFIDNFLDLLDGLDEDVLHLQARNDVFNGLELLGQSYVAFALLLLPLLVVLHLLEFGLDGGQLALKSKLLRLVLSELFLEVLLALDLLLETLAI